SAGLEHYLDKVGVTGSNPVLPTFFLTSQVDRTSRVVFIYVIRSVFTGKLYVGQTADLAARLKEHNLRRCKYTSTFVPWEIVYSEQSINRKSARIREKYLKSTAGKKFLRGINAI